MHNKGVAKAFEEITKQDFGEDPVKWQKWWEENEGKFGKGKWISAIADKERREGNGNI